MRNNRVKIFIALILTVALLICSTVSVFAYEPVITVSSHDWDFDECVSYDYPKFTIDLNDVNNDWQQYSDLNGEGCYFPLNPGDDDFTADVDIKINVDDFEYSNFYMFKYYYGIYLINYNDSFLLALDDDGRLYFNCIDYSNSVSELHIYTLSYPWESWSKSVFYFGGNYYPKFSQVLIYSTVGHYPDFYTDDICYYNSDNSCFYAGYDVSSINGVKPTDLTDSFEYTYTLERTLNCYNGYLATSLSGAQLDLFRLGKYVLRFDDTGFIPFYDSVFSFLSFGLIITDDDYNYLGGYNLINEYPYGNAFDSQKIPASSLNISDYVVFWNNLSFSADKDEEYFILLTWHFACDVPAIFFPGTLDIIEYASYEDDLRHEEILTAISNSSTVIGGAVSDAVTSISGTIEQQMNVLIHGDTGVEKVVIDTSDLNNITVKQDEIIADVYGVLDDEVLNYLPDNYDNPYDYISDSISDFSGINRTFDFIKDMYDKTVAATGMGSVILFCLSFGFATYAIGRRLS